MLTKTSIHFTMALAFAAAITITSCQKEQAKTATAVPDESALKVMISENGNNPDDVMLTDATAREVEEGGYLYTESNDAGQNSILMYKQNTDGTLSLMSTTASGGKGAGMGLASEGAVIIDAQHTYLFAVNAGDSSVSSFWIHSDGSLTLAATAYSGGMMPVSVTCHGNMLYTVNAGSGNICGFTIGSNGSLTQIPGSMQPLSTMEAGPGEIKFHPEGKMLFVTEKGTNKIASFGVDEAGAAYPGVFTNSVGTTPYGFDFAKNNNFMIVSNAAGGAENAGSCTSYEISGMGMISDVNGAVSDHQSAPCWIAPTYYGRFAYTSNTASNTISAYYVSPGGRLFYIPFSNSVTGAAPTDIVVSANNRYFYCINSMSYSIGQYKRKALGMLEDMGSAKNIPPFAAGLACY